MGFDNEVFGIESGPDEQRADYHANNERRIHIIGDVGWMFEV